jgi:PAS domain-containing protein
MSYMLDFGPDAECSKIVICPVPRMEDGKKTNKQLTAEVAVLRQRVRELEALHSKGEVIDTSTTGARKRYEYLLAVSPAIIYTTHATGDFACTFVSENIQTVMGFAPDEMITDPKCWPDRLHPDDAPRVLGELAPLIGKGGGAVEYRFRHRDGHYVWIQDTFKHLRPGKRALGACWQAGGAECSQGQY